jgi:hypothetical protein
MALAPRMPGYLPALTRTVWLRHGVWIVVGLLQDNDSIHQRAVQNPTKTFGFVGEKRALLVIPR